MYETDFQQCEKEILFDNIICHNEYSICVYNVFYFSYYRASPARLVCFSKGTSKLLEPSTSGAPLSYAVYAEAHVPGEV